MRTIGEVTGVQRRCFLGVLLALAALAGCSGSDGGSGKKPGPVATSLAYTNPAVAAAGWALVQDDAATTDTRIVLNLKGPADGSKYRGIGFTLRADPALVKFGKFTDGAGSPARYYRDGGVFRDAFLDSTDPTPLDMAPLLQAGGVHEGKLMVGIFQRGDDEVMPTVLPGFMGPTAKDCGGTVLQVAIELDPGLKAPAGSVPLAVLKARVMPEHRGYLPENEIQNVPLAVGTLTLN
jgi:hypothetical protein